LDEAGGEQAGQADGVGAVAKADDLGVNNALDDSVVVVVQVLVQDYVAEIFKQWSGFWYQCDNALDVSVVVVVQVLVKNYVAEIF
jgi:hypothetical protein